MNAAAIKFSLNILIVLGIVKEFLDRSDTLYNYHGLGTSGYVGPFCSRENTPKESELTLRVCARKRVYIA